MRIFLFFILLMELQIAVAQKESATSSKISKVIIYTQGAQVERTATSAIESGKTELIFNNISPNADKQSIQVKGDGAFTILSVNYQVNYLQQQEISKEVAALNVIQKKLTDQYTYNNSILKVYQQEQSLIEKNQSIGGANTGVNAENLKSVADFQRTRLTEIYLKQNEINIALSSLADSMKAVTAQLNLISGKAQLPTGEIHVWVMAANAMTAKFELSYYVADAGWYANYDLRVEKISAPVQINYKANVYQHTGEDWKDVHITLSNGNPNENGTAPVLYPWRLYYGAAQYKPMDNSGYYNNSINSVSGKITDVNGEPLVGATVVAQGTTVGTIADLNGNYSLQLPPNTGYLEVNYIGFEKKFVPITVSTLNIVMEQTSNVLNEVVITERSAGFAGITGSYKNSAKADLKTIALETNFEYKPTTFTYDIKEPYTILKDGKVITIDVQTLDVQAEYQYYAVPKIDLDAFLTARITDWQDLNLLTGEANLFFEGAYLGKTILDPVNAKDTLEISLGRDKGVSLQRNKLKEFTDRQFIGTNKKETLGYAIVVRNNKQEPIHIIVKDQFPIATENDMEVEQLETSGGTVTPDDGFIIWNLQIAPKEERKLELKYSVKYPKNKQLILE